MFRRKLTWWAVAGGLAMSSYSYAAGTQKVRFNRDIRPIMSDTCFRCHGPDAKSRMAGLRLDIREEALKPTKSGVIPIVPGAPEKSAIIARIFAQEPAKMMPPKYSHKELSEAQKEVIRQWVAEGAEYEGHWAYAPVRRPAVPDLSGPTIRNPIDAFIQERLAREGLQPSPEADRRTLLRRVTLDLTGVPPTAEEMEAFVNDRSPDAYEKVVDRLLASRRFAEMMTMRWLDAVRYADTAGFHGDNAWPIWPYRDYVLKSFHENKPFDEFTREQLAGDLLPHARREQMVAAAFNRLNRVSAEGGIQAKEYLAKYGADRVRTVSTVWLGSTMGCAECHDHKFDPFTTNDFYSMKVFFADIKETGLVPDRGPRAWGAKLLLTSEEQQARLEELDARIKQARAALDERVKQLVSERLEWEERVLKEHAAGRMAWVYQRPVAAQSQRGATLTIYNDEPVEFNFYLRGSLYSETKAGDGLIVASGKNPDNETYVIRLRPGAGEWRSLGVDIHQDETLPGNRVARGADRFVLTEVEAELEEPGQAPRKLSFVLATSHLFGEPGENPAMAAIDGDPKTGWGVSYGEARNPFLALRFAEKLRTSADTVVTVRLHHDSELRRATIGRFRLALSPTFSWPELGISDAKEKARKDPNQAMLNVPVEKGVPPEVLAALQEAEADRSEAQQKLVLDFFAWSSPSLQPQVVELAKLEAQRALFEASIPHVMKTERMRPRVTRVLPRGNWMDDSGEEVQPAIPAFLGKLETGGRRATRLDLANWLVSKDNPLTARTFVNRLWRIFFGTGLSKVLEDLGSQGEWPTHPELLDWLAAEFMEPSWNAAQAHAWDVKHVVRTIVLSHTYRQSSQSHAQLDEKDPDNRLLARQSRFRVDAEIVRDIALAVSGLLVEKFGGPSVRPYQPAGYYSALNFSKRDYSESHGEDLYRRSLYTHWQRTFLHPTLATFDAPSREECTVNRVSSNTPLQALVALNDPIFVEAARVFAQHALKNGKDAGQWLDWAFQRALQREPNKAERKILLNLYQRNLARFKEKQADPAELLSVGEAPMDATLDQTQLAAFTTVTRAILNLHEMIVRN